MTVMVLALVVAGSFATSGIMLAQGASWGMIALGYVAGGWAALLVGGLLLAAWHLMHKGLSLHVMVPAKD